MAKHGPRIVYRQCRIRSHKTPACKIPKGFIHVQAGFHDTIVTVTDVGGRVVSWASASTCGFMGAKRGTPFAAQSATRSAIHPVIG